MKWIDFSPFLKIVLNQEAPKIDELSNLLLPNFLYCQTLKIYLTLTNFLLRLTLPIAFIFHQNSFGIDKSLLITRQLILFHFSKIKLGFWGHEWPLPWKFWTNATFKDVVRPLFTHFDHLVHVYECFCSQLNRFYWR